MRRAFLTAALLFLAGCATVTADLGTGTKPPAGLVIDILEVRETRDGLQVVVEVRNDSSVEFVYRGADATRPVWSYQHLTERAWIHEVRISCGYGLGPLSLRPGARIRAVATLLPRNRLQRMRIGIHEYDYEYTLWSPVIDPATRKAGRHAS